VHKTNDKTKAKDDKVDASKKEKHDLGILPPQIQKHHNNR
jgi:hypothetical protein